MGLKFVPTELVTIFAAPSIQFYTWHNHFFVQLMWRTGLEAPKDLQFSFFNLYPFSVQSARFLEAERNGFRSAIERFPAPLSHIPLHHRLRRGGDSGCILPPQPIRILGRPFYPTCAAAGSAVADEVANGYLDQGSGL